MLAKSSLGKRHNTNTALAPVLPPYVRIEFTNVGELLDAADPNKGEVLNRAFEVPPIVIYAFQVQTLARVKERLAATTGCLLSSVQIGVQFLQNSYGCVGYSPAFDEHDDSVTLFDLMGRPLPGSNGMLRLIYTSTHRVEFHSAGAAAPTTIEVGSHKVIGQTPRQIASHCDRKFMS